MGRESEARDVDAKIAKTTAGLDALKNVLETGHLNVRVAASSVQLGGIHQLIKTLPDMTTDTHFDANIDLTAVHSWRDGVDDPARATRAASPKGCTEGPTMSLIDTGRAGTSGGVGGSSEAADVEGLPAQFQQSPKELAAWFESDPEGFFEELGKLNSEDRGAILMLVQGQIQQTNQIFSMLTNFQSAMHDTQKAMISNLRV